MKFSFISVNSNFVKEIQCGAFCQKRILVWLGYIHTYMQQIILAKAKKMCYEKGVIHPKHYPDNLKS